MFLKNEQINKLLINMKLSCAFLTKSIYDEGKLKKFYTLQFKICKIGYCNENLW